MAVSIRYVDDDASLVEAIQAGDTGAFAELFRRHYPAVKRVCARRLRDLREADEMAQAAFVKAFERIDQCGGDRRFGPWVQVIAHRLCLDHLRARARVTVEEEPIVEVTDLTPDGPEEVLLRSERDAHLHSVLAELPERQREVVIARDLEGRRPGEIAAALGLSIGAVDSLLLRARRRLATTYAAEVTDAGATTLTAAGSSTAAVVGAAAVSTGRASRLAQSVANFVDSTSTHVVTAMHSVPGVSAVAHDLATGLVAGVLALAPFAAGLTDGHIDIPTVPRPAIEIETPPLGLAPLPADASGTLSIAPPAPVRQAAVLVPAAPAIVPGTGATSPVAAPGPVAGPAEDPEAPPPPPPLSVQLLPPEVISEPIPGGGSVGR